MQASPVDHALMQDHFRTDSTVLGVRMGEVFAVVKEFVDPPPAAIAVLLRGDVHEGRVGELELARHRAQRAGREG